MMGAPARGVLMVLAPLAVLAGVAGVVSLGRDAPHAVVDLPERFVDDEYVLGERWALARLGYASGSMPVGGETGVTVHEAGADDGLVLCHYGHEPSATLMTREGRVVHRWAFDLRAHLGERAEVYHDWWRRVHPLDDGGLLAIHEGQYLIALDADSRLRWLYDGGAHHDLDVAPDGDVWVLTREPREIPRLHELLDFPCVDCGRPTLEDFVTRLDPAGRELSRVSLLEAFERSDFAPMLMRLEEPYGDIMHANTLEVLDGRFADRAEAFAAGNVLVSLREMDVIAILDPVAERVVWAMTGLWRAQHQPTFLEDGNLLVFDNKGAAGGSRVIEVDPLTQRVVWTYAGDAERPFYSAECGSNQRLPNGNTLITETDTGRAFEVTRGGRIVWELRSPHRAGADDEYVASLFEAIRVPVAYGDLFR